MLTVAFLATALGGPVLGSLRNWTVGGCIASALMLLLVGAGAFAGPDYPLRPIVFLLGVANGAFAVAAIGSMMSMAGSGAAAREGTRIGLWGAAQAIAFGLGGFLGALIVDLARHATGDPGLAFAIAFFCGAMTFLLSASLALNISAPDNNRQATSADAIPGKLIDA
jgi:BCD family chlorophyll transporter-like MFS transporter